MAVNFKIITVGWNCPRVLTQTLQSVAAQEYPHWQIHIVDDASHDQQIEVIKRFVEQQDERWSYSVNPENYGVVRSQYEGVRKMNPEDEDIIVYLDLDGDMLAHPNVLDHLVEYYSDGTLMTYGNFRPLPDYEPGMPMPVFPFPDDVVRNNSYRDCLLRYGARFNHLRTVKWKVLKEIPESYFKWPDGSWMFCASDYAVMAGSLEISGGKYRCLDEVLMYYNAHQPSPDNVRHPQETHRCCLYSLAMTPLERKF